MPKVSVIIPIYNVEKYLEKCLDSVCNQTLKDIEIICIDDCSTDNSLTILKDYARKDTRIKIIEFSENKGVSIARNVGIDTAQGKYIGFVDSDDYIDLSFYEQLYDKILEDDYDAVKGQLKSVNGDVENLDMTHTLIKHHKAFFYHYFTTAIYKLSFIKKHNIYFPIEKPRGQDYLFTVKAAIFYDKISIIDGGFYYHIKTDDYNEKAYTDCAVKSSIDCMNDIFTMITVHEVNIKHYCIIYYFITRICNSFKTNKNVSDLIKKYIIDKENIFLSNLKYHYTDMIHYLHNISALEKSLIFSNLRKRIVK